jgi:fibronectin-binding autotransporter adhesin
MVFRTKRDTRPTTHPAIEGLEGRVVPATFHVSNVAALQADVATLSASSVPNTIVLNPGIYNLTGVLRINGANDLTLEGKATKQGGVTILAPTGNRAIEVDGGSVTVVGLTVAGGSGVDRGGGILARNAVVTLRNVAVSGNTASQAGGGVFADGGTLNVVGSSILSNGAVNPADARGGGIGALNANVVITNGILNSNTAVSTNLNPSGVVNATGAGLYAEGGTVTITRSTFAHNSSYTATLGPSATSTGGAVSSTDAAVTLKGTSLSGNGLIALSAAANNTRGSAFETNGGTLTVTNSTLGGNLPGGTGQFDHTGGATVVLKNTTVDGQKQIASRTLTS